MRKALFQTMLEPADFHALKLLSALTKRPMNVYVREGVVHVLKKYAPVLQAAEERAP